MDQKWKYLIFHKNERGNLIIVSGADQALSHEIIGREPDYAVSVAGEHGWELVTVTPETCSPHLNNLITPRTYYFKKPNSS